MALNIDRKTAGDKIVLSTTPQVDAATAAVLDKLLVFDEDSFIRQVPDAETNEDEKKGFVEATAVDVKGLTSELQLNTSKMIPDHLAWALRYIAGAPTTTALGIGFRHVFRMANYPTNPPYFTAAHRKGGASAASAPADFARFRGLGISKLELKMQKDQFTSLRLTGVGIGYVDDGIITVEFKSGSAPTWGGGGTTTVTLPSDPEGSSDGERAQRIFATCDKDGDGQYETLLTVNSYVASTNVLTLGGGPTSGAHPVRVTYDRDDVVDTWKTEVASATGQSEYKSKAVNMRLYIGSGIDTTDANPDFDGGQYAACELDDATWTFDWAAAGKSCWAVTDPPDILGFAQAVETGSVVQRLTVNRGISDWLLKQSRDLDVPLSFGMWGKGPEWETGNRYLFRVLYPFCKVLTHKQAPNEQKWRDEEEVAILQDPGIAAGGLQDNQNTFAAVIQNKVASYA